MKKLLWVLSAVVLCACGSKTTLPPSTGGPYEVLAVCRQPVWEGPVGDTLRRLFKEEIPMLNQPEPWFDLLRVDVGSYNNVILRHKNQLIIQVDPKYTTTGMSAAYDVYSIPQIIVTATAPSQEALMEYIREHAQQVREVFDIAVQERAVAAMTKYKNKLVADQLEQKFGFTMAVSKGYKIRNEMDDFFWASMEYQFSSKGFFVYSYPYTGSEDFSTENILAKRDEFAARIPGEADGSFMARNEEMEPMVRNVRISGRLWVEMRGFWDVKHDFMGGPYISYTTLDTQTNRVVTIDCYVYSPREPKKPFIRDLENMMLTVHFKGDPKE